MKSRTSRLLYEVVTSLGINPAHNAADVPDQRLIEVVEGVDRLEPGRALDLGCGAGRNTLYLARHGWDVIGIDMLSRSVDKARSRAVGDAASARFLQGDVTRLGDLDIGGGYRLINDSGCYYGLPGDRRDAYAAGVTRAASAGALLLMSGFAKLPLGTAGGIGEEELRRRFSGWDLRTSARVPISEITRHTRIPFPLRAAMTRGRLQIRRFELTRS